MMFGGDGRKIVRRVDGEVGLVRLGRGVRIEASRRCWAAVGVVGDGVDEVHEVGNVGGGEGEGLEMGGRDLKVGRREGEGLRVLGLGEVVEGLRDLVRDVDAPMSRGCGSWEVVGVVEEGGMLRVGRVLLVETRTGGLFVRNRKGRESDGRGGGLGSRGGGAGDGDVGSVSVLFEFALE